MRILMICYEFPPLGGGGSKVVHGLSKELTALGHQIELVTMGFRGLPMTEEIDGIRITRVACWRKRESVCTLPEAASYLFAAMPAVLSLTRGQHYDLNHTHFILPDGVLAWRLRQARGIPYLLTAHGSDAPGYNPDRLIVEHRLLAPVWRAVVGSAERVVCPSRTLETLVRQANGGSTTAVIPNGFDVDRLRPDRRKDKRILIVTRMFERKGVQYVLQALSGVRLDHAVDIVGEGPYLPVLQHLARELKVPVKFWGWLDNRSSTLRDLYETANIFVLASEAENFPIVLLEAMAAGCAIVTTSGTGCAEVVGEAGRLVAPRDTEGMRQALHRLMTDEAECAALGAAARRRVEVHFSWPAVAQQYVQLYQNVQRNGR